MLIIMLYILIILNLILSNTKENKKEKKEDKKVYTETYYDEFGKPHKRKVKYAEEINTDSISPSNIKVENPYSKTEAPGGTKKEKETFKPKTSPSKKTDNNEDEMPDFSEMLKKMGGGF